MSSLPAEHVTRAMLEGALQKANYAVQADASEDFEYAVQSYSDSCHLLAQVIRRTAPGSEDWTNLEAIVGEAMSRSKVGVLMTIGNSKNCTSSELMN